MRPFLCSSAVIGGPAAALLLLFGGAARADAVPCEDIGGGAPVIYGAGGSAQTPLIGKAAVQIQGSDDPIFVAYQDAGGACTGINALTGVAPATITGTAKYWDAAGTQLSCELPLEGATVQFAVMGNGARLCPLITDDSLLTGITTVQGPVGTVNVLVPAASTQQSISAEALYLVYGFGPAADIAPWNNADLGYYIRRNENSFVQLYLSVATGLPVTKFVGTDAGSNGNTIVLLSGLADPEQGIGFASGEVADANRANVRTLAWQHVGQNAGYWPDSTATAFDKINVRTGRYYLWGAVNFFGRAGSTAGSFADANVGAFLGYLDGASTPAGVEKSISDLAIENRNIPECAMYVARDGDLTPIYQKLPAEPCHCTFEYRATGATDCAVCDDSTPCASGTCRGGFCEEY